MKNGVHHAELYGKRQRKYDWLDANDHDSTNWREVNPDSPGLSVCAPR